jgi:hypothetical protein
MRLVDSKVSTSGAILATYTALDESEAPQQQRERATSASR